jgi:hypothetical protein
VFLLASLNRETRVFLPVAVFLASLRDWRPFGVSALRRVMRRREPYLSFGLVVLSTAIFAGLRLILGSADPVDAPRLRSRAGGVSCAFSPACIRCSCHSYWYIAANRMAVPASPRDTRSSRVGLRLIAIAALLLAAVAVRGTELYTSRYQSLPVLDWIESRPPLTESDRIPSAADHARGLARTMPQLVIADDARPWTPVFGPPAALQRTMGGVRDASRILLVSPGFESARAPVQARLYVVVFDRTLRSSEWVALMGREMDIRDPDSGLSQERVTGPDSEDSVWVVSPRQTGGISTVVGHRGPVAFDLQVTFGPPPAALPPDATAARPEVVDLSARAEAAARQAAADYASWLATQTGG